MSEVRDGDSFRGIQSLLVAVQREHKATQCTPSYYLHFMGNHQIKLRGENGSPPGVPRTAFDRALCRLIAIVHRRRLH